MVEVGGTTTALLVAPVDAESEAPDVVVAATDDERSLVRLLADFRRPILTVTSHAGEVTALLQESA